MPNYAATNTKKYLDAAGLTYFSSKLNDYPTNDVIAAVIDGVQDALDEKMYVEEYDDYSDFPLAGAAKTLYIDTTMNSVYIWDGTKYVHLNPGISAITDAEIDALFE
jgi:hypothetical protein